MRCSTTSRCGHEVETLLGAGIYPGMVTATVGTALLVAVGLTSVVDRPARLPYEWWYAVHLAATPGSRSPGSTRSRPGTSWRSTRWRPTTGERCTS